MKSLHINSFQLTPNFYPWLWLYQFGTTQPTRVSKHFEIDLGEIDLQFSADAGHLSQRRPGMDQSAPMPFSFLAVVFGLKS
jgi:hypothetical protein